MGGSSLEKALYLEISTSIQGKGKEFYKNESLKIGSACLGGKHQEHNIEGSSPWD